MTIKKITAIVRNDVLERVEQRLQAVRPPGITVSTVKGYGEYANFFEHDWLVRHARIEIFAPDEQVDEIVEAIRDGARTGGPGDGFVAVLPVERMLRTRESPAPHGQHAQPIIARATHRPGRVPTALAQMMVVLAVLVVFAAYLVPAVHRFHFLACSVLPSWWPVRSLHAPSHVTLGDDGERVQPRAVHCASLFVARHSPQHHVLQSWGERGFAST